jgi:3D (Asp-Asp-Asp) domain-containing protein
LVRGGPAAGGHLEFQASIRIGSQPLGCLARLIWGGRRDIAAIRATIRPTTHPLHVSGKNATRHGLSVSMTQRPRSILARSRAHVATILVAAAAAALVSLGVGTAQRASSTQSPAEDGAVLSASETTLRPATERAATQPLAQILIDRSILRRVLTGVRRESVFEAVAAALGIPPAVSGPRAAPTSEGETPQVALYNGRPVRAVATLRMRVTAYSPDWRSCGASADGITASGYSVLTNGGFMVAADPRVLPLGSLVSVPGYDGGAVVPVLDTGGAIKGNRLDVLYPTHEVAMCWGVQDVDVVVWEYADGLPNGFRRVRRPAR